MKTFHTALIATLTAALGVVCLPASAHTVDDTSGVSEHSRAEVRAQARQAQLAGAFSESADNAATPLAPLSQHLARAASSREEVRAQARAAQARGEFAVAADAQTATPSGLAAQPQVARSAAAPAQRTARTGTAPQGTL